VITEGHLVRHFNGVTTARDAAILDVAQDHLLFLLHQGGWFDQGLVFKGGTALRKYRAGGTGRFSTDLDFAAPDPDLALNVLNAVDGAAVAGFGFAVRQLGDDGRRADIQVDTPFGSPNLGAKIELSRHPLALAAEVLEPVALPIHRVYDITLPAIPVVRVEEAIAEKLARLRRASLARDLYDLQWFAARGVINESLVRRLWVLKVFRDVVHDGRGDKPLTAGQVLRERKPAEFEREDIGYLTRPVELAKWIATVRTRFAFLADLDPDEARWASCNQRHDHEVADALHTLADLE
jgi:predicted nucleotidyltransferase component of viral defense system